MLEPNTKPIIETSNIPYQIGQPYGWIAEVPATDLEIRVVEFLKLPGAGNWNKDDKIRLSKDGSIGLLEYTIKPTNGIISGFWSIAKNDPTGPHSIRVFIGDAKPLTFLFSIERENGFSSSRRSSIRRP